MTSDPRRLWENLYDIEISFFGNMTPCETGLLKVAKYESVILREKWEAYSPRWVHSIWYLQCCVNTWAFCHCLNLSCRLLPTMTQHEYKWYRYIKNSFISSQSGYGDVSSQYSGMSPFLTDLCETPDIHTYDIYIYIYIWE